MGFFGGSSSGDKSSNSESPSADFNPPSSPLSSPSPFGSSTSTSTSTALRNRIQSDVTARQNLLNARILMSKVNENCFDHCIPAPGNTLSSKESQCLSSCMEKYIDAWNTVSRTYMGRIQREGGGGLIGGPQ
ncbi:Mitochondrial import inner membrane translocase subunit TIM13 [Cyphellophora attinorum]|uniref:Mitochondrial import inner membrane translocase subunit n=1 Tax=Cyphellophora attinorum TaxID=1664694 RepID=A0A0N0NLH6_9EURO|nr:Mitochondrial import inner membrane translocase subunit TIM13 [Phialophora attinorum]KPI39311.1 Mitochondrial import inner membrane translocase subunit TIM13 [Phialophora attinorum]